MRTLLNILEHMKDISSVALGTPHVLFDQVIESYTSHKSNRREYVFEFIFTDSFIRYVSALPTIEKVDSIDLP